MKINEVNKVSHGDVSREPCGTSKLEVFSEYCEWLKIVNYFCKKQSFEFFSSESIISNAKEYILKSLTDSMYFSAASSSKVLFSNLPKEH